MAASSTINGDLSVRVAVDTAAMQWTPSPSRTVWRKRVHLVGPAEAGQVTSVVRYEPGSKFHVHDHPNGEEILVLEGVFSDEHGDWPAGTYLLNPEGFRHAPFSREGCVLFVKLRQYPSRTRAHIVVVTPSVPWEPGDRAGVEIRPLYSQAGFADHVRSSVGRPTSTSVSAVTPAAPSYSCCAARSKTGRDDSRSAPGCDCRPARPTRRPPAMVASSI